MSAKPLPSDANESTCTTLAGVVQVDVCKPKDHELGRRVVDLVAEEVPVALVFNGVSHAVMLASPTDLEDFARGFAFTEGIVDSPSQIYDIEVKPVLTAQPVPQGSQLEGYNMAGFEVQVEIASSAFVRLKDKRRNLTGRTGCGLCGTESLEQVLRPLPSVPAQRMMRVDASLIERALAALPPHQQMQLATGATHAAAWFSSDGQLRLIREDVGRHNALDKLIGAGLIGDPASFGSGFVLVTSRASMEMAQKTLAAGFGMLVAVSAPTSLAIEIAKRHGLALVGFARPGRCVVYNAPAGMASLAELRSI